MKKEDFKEVIKGVKSGLLDIFEDDRLNASPPQIKTNIINSKTPIVPDCEVGDLVFLSKYANKKRVEGYIVGVVISKNKKSFSYLWERNGKIQKSKNEYDYFLDNGYNLEGFAQILID